MSYLVLETADAGALILSDSPEVLSPSVNVGESDLAIINDGETYAVTLQHLGGAVPETISIRYTSGLQVILEEQDDFVYTPDGVNPTDVGVITFTQVQGNLPFGTTGFRYVIELDVGPDIIHAITFLPDTGLEYIVALNPVDDETNIIADWDSGESVNDDQIEFPTIVEDLTLEIFANFTYQLSGETFPTSLDFPIRYWSKEDGEWHDVTVNLDFSPAFALSTPTAYTRGASVDVSLINVGTLEPESVIFIYGAIEVIQSDFSFEVIDDLCIVSFTVTRGNLPYFDNLTMRVTFDDDSEIDLEDITLNVESGQSIEVADGNELFGVASSILDSFSGPDPDVDWIIKYPIVTPKGGDLVVNDNWTYSIQYDRYVQTDILELELWNTTEWFSFTKTIIIDPPSDATAFTDFTYEITYRPDDNKLVSTDPTGEGA
jgi:hypothetical protein